MMLSAARAISGSPPLTTRIAVKRPGLIVVVVKMETVFMIFRRGQKDTEGSSIMILKATAISHPEATELGYFNPIRNNVR